MPLQLHKGTTSKLLEFFVQDTTKTDGSGLTGLAFGTAGLSAYYYREGAASATLITLQTMTLGTWATGGFIVVDGTNMPGVYQLGLPDAALATGANSVVVMLKGAANTAPVLREIQLTDTDVNNGTSFGLTDLDATISSRLAAASITLAAGAVTVGTNNDKTGYSLVANAVDAAQFTQAAADKVWTSAARTLTAFAQSFADQVWASATRLLTAFGFTVTVATNNDKTGYSLAVAPPTAAQIDTQLSGTHGSGQWGPGTGIGANTVTLTVQNSTPTPLLNAAVTIKNTAETAVIARGLTDSLGRVVFNLDNGSYHVLIVAPVPYFTLPAQLLVVSGTTAATYTFTGAAPGPAPAASLCQVFGTLRNLDGSPAAGAVVSFVLTDRTVIVSNDNLIVVNEVSAACDTNGLFTANLTRSSLIGGLKYHVSSPPAHLEADILVPDSGSIDLLTLLPS